jgi:hypothetical protein
MMQLRRFNDLGIKSFAEYLDALRANPTAPVPTDLLTKPTLTEPLASTIEAEPHPFATRMDFARWLHEAAQRAGTEIPRRDAGFWAWLTLALFDTVCPVDKIGARKVKEDARYLPLLDTSRRYYRHALVGPYNVYLLYMDNPDWASALLCGPLAKLTDEAYRLFVENQLVVHRPAVAVLSDFYYDTKRQRLKRGSQSRTQPGSIRRFAKVLTQYARTFDLDVIPEQRLSSMLPREFDRWRTSPLFNQPA